MGYRPPEWNNATANFSGVASYFNTANNAINSIKDHGKNMVAQNESILDRASKNKAEKDRLALQQAQLDWETTGKFDKQKQLNLEKNALLTNASNIADTAMNQAITDPTAQQVADRFNPVMDAIGNTENLAITKNMTPEQQKIAYQKQLDISNRFNTLADSHFAYLSTGANEYEQALRNSLNQEGVYSPAEIDGIVNKKVASKFNTISTDQAKNMSKEVIDLAKLAKVTGSSGKSVNVNLSGLGSGVSNNVATYANSPDQVNQFIKDQNIPESKGTYSGIINTFTGDSQLTKDKVEELVAKGQKRGISTGQTLTALAAAVKDGNLWGIIPDRNPNVKNSVLEDTNKFFEYAKSMGADKEVKKNKSSNGSITLARDINSLLAKKAGNKIDAINAKTVPSKGVSQKDLFNYLLGGPVPKPSKTSSKSSKTTFPKKEVKVRQFDESLDKPTTKTSAKNFGLPTEYVTDDILDTYYKQKNPKYEKVHRGMRQMGTSNSTKNKELRAIAKDTPELFKKSSIQQVKSRAKVFEQNNKKTFKALGYGDLDLNTLYRAYTLKYNKSPSTADLLKVISQSKHKNK